MNDTDNSNDLELMEHGLAEMAHPAPRRRSASEMLQAMSHQDFMRFGMTHIAYIRQIVLNDYMLYGLFAADGTNISLHDSEAAAINAAHDNNLSPVHLY